MSSKAKRPTTSVSSTFSTPTSTEGPTRSRSPLSPTRITRQQEKAELQHLNDRLATYVNEVRNLQHENVRLFKEVEVSRECSSREISTFRAMYEQELADARKLLDDEATSRARTEIDNKRLREENEDLRSSVDRLSKDLRSLEATLSVLESRNVDLQTKYNKLVTESKKHDDDLRELDKLRKTVDNQKKIIENETLARIEIENKLQSIREEANFKEQVWKKEVEELTTKRRKEISEVDGRLTAEYENKLQAAVQELREQNELQQQANRDEITELYENKIKNLQNYYQRTAAEAAQKIEDLRSMQQRYDTMQTQVGALEAQNVALNARARELEKLLEQERANNVEQLAQLEAELVRTRDEMNAQLKDYQELMDIKVALDLELSVYRKLLESEEQRLNISTTVQKTRRGTPQRRSNTPSTRSGGAVKRRRMFLGESEQYDKFEVTAETRGDIMIEDAEPNGQFIQLFNRGDNELSLGGWSLKHAVAGSGAEGENDRETTFKFHRSVKIEPKGKVTVWSADSGHAHEPPVNILMKQKWFAGDVMTTLLLNNEGEQIAVRQRQRVQSSTYRLEEDGEDNVDVPGTQKEQCFIM